MNHANGLNLVNQKQIKFDAPTFYYYSNVSSFEFFTSSRIDEDVINCKINPLTDHNFINSTNNFTGTRIYFKKH